MLEPSLTTYKHIRRSVAFTGAWAWPPGRRDAVTPHNHVRARTESCELTVRLFLHL